MKNSIVLPSVPTFALLDSFIKASSQGQTAFAGTDSIVSWKRHHNCIEILIVRKSFVKVF